MTENNRRQAQIPEGAIPLENPVGTAPCFIVEDPRGIVISLPGVPREMQYMMTHTVLPYLKQKLGLHQVIKARTLKTCGIGESALDARIADLEQSSNPTIGLAAHPGQSHIRITAKADSQEQADAMIAEMEAHVRERVGEVIFGADDDTLQSAIIALLAERNRHIAVAEVDTLGMISGWLNGADPDGRTFYGGWVLPTRHQWVMGQDSTASKDARQEGLRLASAVCTVTGADLGLSVLNTGPDETYILAIYSGQVHEFAVRFRGHEEYAQTWVASQALDLVRRMCLGLPDHP